MIVGDNWHDIAIWHIIVLCKNVIQIIILHENFIMYFIIHCFQYTSMKYKPYPKTIVPYDISYD